jgi:hypothetical protein
MKGYHPDVVKTMEKHVFLATFIKGYHPDVVKSMEKTRVFSTLIKGPLMAALRNRPMALQVGNLDC